ncbi:hypothetical protein H0A71_18820 [Alcaligenaceae bacterium]|nr:hypothetical protein [Alcaligenaceae bacterium]
MSSELSIESNSELGDEAELLESLMGLVTQRPTADGTEKFYRDIHTEIKREVAESTVSAADLFFEKMAARLETCGEIETFDRAYFDGLSGKRIVRVDGSGGDESARLL